jgi:hypothetical protein
MTDPVIEDYIADLDRKSKRLPVDVRRELHTYVKEHLDEEFRSTPSPDPSEVRRALSALGDPAKLVADMERLGPEGARAAGSSYEKRALLWLTIGSLLPGAGWLVGIALLWRSTLWTVRDKVIGTLAFPGGVWGVLWSWWNLGWASEQRCTTSSSGASERLGGPPLGVPVDTIQECTQVGPVPPIIAWVLLLVVATAAIAGPWWLYTRMRLHRPPYAHAY